MRNNRGPKTVPCEAPEVTGAGVEVCPSTKTCSNLLARKLISTGVDYLGNRNGLV